MSDWETKENLTRMRSGEAITAFGSDVYSELEKMYGKYLYVPYDVPKILPYDINKFVDFYFRNAKFSQKLREDIAEGIPPKYDTTPYLSVDGDETNSNSVWSKNRVPEIFTEFPEIFEQINEYMPWVNGPQSLSWTMWSSAKDILPHRDLKSMLDMPIRVRIKLFDSNPVETLSVQLAPVDKPQGEFIPLSIPSDTNSFAWNNLRTRHRSLFTPSYKKILMIFFANYKGVSMNKYVDMLDRSVHKYKDHLIIDDQTTAKDYISC